MYLVILVQFFLSKIIDFVLHFEINLQNSNFITNVDKKETEDCM